MERFFSASDKDETGNFQLYLILCLTFSFIFTAIRCLGVSHNLSQNWGVIIVLLRMLHVFRQISKHICGLANSPQRKIAVDNLSTNFAWKGNLINPAISSFWFNLR